MAETPDSTFQESKGIIENPNIDDEEAVDTLFPKDEPEIIVVDNATHIEESIETLSLDKDEPEIIAVDDATQNQNDTVQLADEKKTDEVDENLCEEIQEVKTTEHQVKLADAVDEEHMKSALTLKDQEIEKLQSELVAKNDELNHLREDLSKKNEEIETLHNEIKSLSEKNATPQRRASNNEVSSRLKSFEAQQVTYLLFHISDNKL